VTNGSKARATICFTVDFDAVSIWMSWGATGARALSRGEFGAQVGAPRLLDLFKKHEIITTWFVPGHTAETYPSVTKRVVEAGHEIGNHGYAHEVFDKLEPDEMRRVVRAGSTAIERVTGRRPNGIRVPAGDFDGSLFEMLVEEGFVYDSSVFGEFEPFWCRAKPQLNFDGPNVEGRELPLVQLPLSHVLNDFNYFEFNYAAPQLHGSANPDHVFGIWKAQLDYMYSNHPGGVLNITSHPQSIGWGLRTQGLDRFLSYCKGLPGLRFATCRTVADEFKERFQ
jgi:peptidoglycan/xylan/chitin deacetylase (PgdA/CDA1 family)